MATQQYAETIVLNGEAQSKTEVYRAGYGVK